MTTLNLTEEQLKQVKLSLIGERGYIQENLATKKYSDEYTLETVYKLREIQEVIDEVFKQDKEQRAKR